MVLKQVGEIKVKSATTRPSTNPNTILFMERGQSRSTAKDYRSRQVTRKSWTTGTAYAAFGVNASLIPIDEGMHRDYACAMQIPMPLSRIVGKYALLMSVSIRTFPLCPMTFRILDGSNLAIARILSPIHPFMEACDRGDLIAVRTMLQTGEGRASDITEDNWSPLTVSAQQCGRTILDQN